MKRKLILIFFLLILVHSFTLENAFADHIQSGQYKKDSPIDADTLSESQKEELKNLQSEINRVWSEYHEKVAEEATKWLKNKGKDIDMFGMSIALKEVIPPLEEEYFGSKSSYGDKKFGELAEKIWNLGYASHFARFKDGAFDSCSDEGGEGDAWFGDGVCEGFPRGEYGFTKDKVIVKAIIPVKFYKARSKEKEKAAYPSVIASEGMFTKSQIDDTGKCNITEISEKYQKEDSIPKPVIQEERVSGMKPKTWISGVSDKVGEEMTETFRKGIDSFDKYFFDGNCNTSSTSVLAQVLNITKPVNVTNNRFVMALTSVSSQIAMAASIIFIAFYSLMYTSGYQGLNPIKFGINLFFCILAISYLPYLVQDVLNLNNTIVHNVSNIEWKFDAFETSDGKKYEGISGTSPNILAGSFDGIFQTLFDETGGKQDLILLVMVFIVLFISILPLLRLVFYWYIRYIKILIMLIVGPFMIIAMCLPSTNQYGKTWMNRMFGEIFSQTIVTFGFLIIGLSLSHISEISTINHFGWFGVMVFLLASTFMLSEMPSFSKSFFEGVSGFSSDGPIGAGKKLVSGTKRQGVEIGRGIMKGLQGKQGGGTLIGKTANKLTGGVRNTGVGIGKGLIGKSTGEKAGLTQKLGHSVGGLMRKPLAMGGKSLKEGVKHSSELATIGAKQGINDAKKKLQTTAQNVGLATSIAANTLTGGKSTQGIKKSGNSIVSSEGPPKGNESKLGNIKLPSTATPKTKEDVRKDGKMNVGESVKHPSGIEVFSPMKKGGVPFNRTIGGTQGTEKMNKAVESVGPNKLPQKESKTTLQPKQRDTKTSSNTPKTHTPTPLATNTKPINISPNKVSPRQDESEEKGVAPQKQRKQKESSETLEHDTQHSFAPHFAHNTNDFDREYDTYQPKETETQEVEVVYEQDTSDTNQPHRSYHREKEDSPPIIEETEHTSKPLQTYSSYQKEQSESSSVTKEKVYGTPQSERKSSKRKEEVVEEPQNQSRTIPTYNSSKTTTPEPRQPQHPSPKQDIPKANESPSVFQKQQQKIQKEMKKIIKQNDKKDDKKPRK